MAAPTARTTRLHRQDGFTVSELVLVTVFVVGLLLVAFVSVRSIRDDTAQSNCQTELRNLKLATQQYLAENDAYPIDKSVLVDTGKLDPDDAAGWALEFEATSTTPTYRAVGSCA